jgi:glycosyltransferase involved in cell wall biosynthesis
LKILITNLEFAHYTGTEVVARDLASAFFRAGHEPVIFSPTLGKIADEVRGMGIQVIDDLSMVVDSPDIIHGHQHRPLVEALLRFPDTPAVSICHDAISTMDVPYFFPRIQRYLAVDERCRRRVERALGVRAGEIGIVPNAVDLRRFPPRGPLPLRARRAIVFSNYASNGTHLKAVRAACRRSGIQLEVMGKAAGTECSDPGKILLDYDLVFAKARCALEALAVGNAVVLCDFAGAGPYVTLRDLDQLRLMNFGAGVLTNPLEPKLIAEQIARYDEKDAAQVARRIRSETCLDTAALGWIKLYSNLIDRFDPGEVNRDAEYRAFADYLAAWHYLKRKEWEWKQVDRLKEIPLLGRPVRQLAGWAIRRMFSRPSNATPLR